MAELPLRSPVKAGGVAGRGLSLRYGLPALALAAATFAAVPATQAQASAERLQICYACHGPGQSPTENVPSLGAQPSPYVLIQLYMFREKLRTAEPMNDMAKDLTDADLQSFADTIAKLPAPQPTEAPDPARAERAKAIAATHRCAFCHNNFAGGDAVPRLAGQREDYLIHALREYKAAKRTEYQPVMAEVMPRVSDADILDLAHYLSRLQLK